MINAVAPTYLKIPVIPENLDIFAKISDFVSRYLGSKFLRAK
ncbi:MAG: hypothetical protein V7L31_31585 [Nostoc sp.]